MAGIGFTLKKLFEEDSFIQRTKAYIYSSIVAAGPWIAAVVTVNAMLFIAKYYFSSVSQRSLFMGTIVYSFVFSQVVTTPWQLLITRYISDKLYTKSYEYIKSSFLGLSKIIFFISITISTLYYWNKPLPWYYKYMAVTLFCFLSLSWIVMVYLGAIKNYSIISKAYIIGGIVAFLLLIYSSNYQFLFYNSQNEYASNMIFSYVIGIVITYSILLYSFYSTFYHGNDLEYDFLRYLNKFPKLFFVGLFYILGLWADDLIMWYSSLGVNIQDTYRYAPIYDNAVFLAYLTVIPTMVLFMISVETEFYQTYKKYYGLASGFGTYREISRANDIMKKSIIRQLFYTMEIQTIISVVIIVLAGKIFSFFNMTILLRDIFRICVLGALCNMFVFIIILILLYFESKKNALAISFMLFFFNSIFTYIFLSKGVNYFGLGFFISNFITMIVAIAILIVFMKKINYYTFAKQPLFKVEQKGAFVYIADKLNNMKEKRYYE